MADTRAAPAAFLLSGRTFSSLKIRDFRWYWISTLASFMAMQMQQVARGWLIYDLTSSPMALALVMLAFAAPMTVFSLFGGVLADRVPKRKLLAITQGFNVVATLVLAVLVSTGLITFWQLLVLGVFNGSFVAFNLPSRQAIIPQLVGEKSLMNAIALGTAGMNVSRIVGPALAGVAIAFVGTAAVFYFVAAAYVFSVLTILMISTPAAPMQASRARMGRDMGAGLRYVATTPVLLSLLAMAFIPLMFGMSFMPLMPAWAVEALELGPKGLGLLMTVTGVGALVGSLALASLGDFRRRGMLLLGASFLWGASLAIFAQSTSLAVTLSALLLVGFLSSVYMALNQSLTQIYASPEMRGRVMSINMMTFGMMPMGALPVSAAAERIGTPDAIAVSAIILMLVTLAFGVANQRLRRLA